MGSLAKRTGYPVTSDAIRLYRSADAQRLVEQVYLPKAEIWVATRNETLTGFIGLVDTLVGSLFVDPPHQRTGVARALVAHALERKNHTSNWKLTPSIRAPSPSTIISGSERSVAAPKMIKICRSTW